MAGDRNSHEPTDHGSGSSSLVRRRMVLGRDAALLSRGLALSGEMSTGLAIQSVRASGQIAASPDCDPSVVFRKCLVVE